MLLNYVLQNPITTMLLQKSIKWSIALVSVALLISSCKKEEDTPTPPPVVPQTIAQIAVANDFDSLVVALDRAGLVSTFSNTTGGPFTVFAPTNAAFVDLLDDLGYDAISEIPSDLLDDVLKYHVVSGEVFSSALSENLVASTLESYTLRFTLNGGAQVWTSSSESASITTTDLDASNGVIHVINKVLVPNRPTSTPTQDIVDVAVANGFDSLAVALTRAGLVSTFEGTTVYTVFAPTNQAFVDLLADLNLSRIAQIPTTTLVDVLTYHVTPGYVFASQLVNNQDISTLNEGSTFRVKINGSAVSLEDALTGNSDAGITLTDVRASNGVVHVINKVLRP